VTTLDWIVASTPAVAIVIMLIAVAVYEIFFERHYY